jgi:hypothetical protein
MRRRGRFGGLGAAVADLAGAVRRARDARAVGVRVYDAAGHARRLDPASAEAKAALEAAKRLQGGLAEARKLHENGDGRS